MLHDALHGLVFPLVLPGAIDGVARHQSQDVAFRSDDGEAFVAGAQHVLVDGVNWLMSKHGADAERHHVAHLDAWAHEVGEQGAQFGEDVDGLALSDERGGGAVVPTAAEMRGDLGHIDVVRAAAGDELRVAADLHEHKQRRRIEQIA